MVISPNGHDFFAHLHLQNILSNLKFSQMAVFLYKNIKKKNLSTDNGAKRAEIRPGEMFPCKQYWNSMYNLTIILF